MEKLHYICGRKVNRTVAYCNNIYGKFQDKMHTTKPPILIPISSNKNLNARIDDIIHGNYISKYYQEHGGYRKLKK